MVIFWFTEGGLCIRKKNKETNSLEERKNRDWEGREGGTKALKKRIVGGRHRPQATVQWKYVHILLSKMVPTRRFSKWQGGTVGGEPAGNR